jgi:tetratricopeptide (TPR) repeat protein
MSMAVCLLLAGVISPAQESGDPFFLQVRKAVSEENVQGLHLLARMDPWSFREVTNRLADLALNQTLEEEENDVLGGYNRFLVAGLLAGIYLEETGDRSLAERLHSMREWSEEDVEERRQINLLLEATDEEDHPAPRQLEKAVARCQALEDDRCVGMVHGALGHLLEMQGHADAAALNYERAGQAFRRARELPRLRDALLSRGQLLLENGHYADAAADLGSASAVAEELGDPVTRTGSLLLLAQALVRQGQREQALHALAAARDTALAANLHVLAARAILIRTGLRDGGEPIARSARDYEAAARLAEKGQDRVIVSKCYLEAARAHNAGGDPVQGAADIEKALAAARLAGIEGDIPVMLLLAADLHSNADDLPRALRRLDEAWKLYLEAGNLAGQARALEQKGTLLLEAERIQEAAGPLTEAHRLAQEVGDVLTEGRVEGGLAVLAMMAGRSQEAITRYRRSAELLAEAGDPFQAMRMRGMAESIERETAAQP